jgi:hypothetical protein
MSNTLLQDRIAQRGDDVPLANQVTEGLRPITPGDYRVRSLGVPGHENRSIAVEINPGFITSRTPSARSRLVASGIAAGQSDQTIQPVSSGQATEC